MDAAQQLGQVQQQIHQELSAVRDLVNIQQQQLAVLQQQLVQQGQQRPAASPVSFTAKLPEFTGAGRVDLWTRDLDMLFIAKKCDPESAYDWACTALKGLALQSLVSYHGGREWEELKLFLLTRFKPLSFNVEVRQSLHELKMHHNDLEKYLHEFHELGLQVPSMGDAESIYMFCHGLPGEIKAEIMYKGCTTLQAAIEVASAFHQAHYSAK
jgi:hypothetical protein